jgi:two-component system OmpR family sensor kinase
MSIRLRFTLVYNAILALTLAIFSVTLYSIQANTTLEALKKDLRRGSETLGTSVLQAIINPDLSVPQPSNIEPPPPKPFNTFSGDQVFVGVPEREIVRVLDSSGNLIASPYGRPEDALPLSREGLQTLQNKQEWWEINNVQNQRALIYSRPIISGGRVAYILQVARMLTERDNSLQTLGTTLVLSSLVTVLAAFGIGWALSAITLTPIHNITQAARTIGEKRDFTRRVSYEGPQDEVGQLATTFNSMLARLQEGYQRIAHSLEMQRNFVADVSHELRTPLTTLRGNLELLRRVPPIPAHERADILDDMVGESDRLIRLVNELLTLARADVKRNLDNCSIVIFPILEEVCRQARKIDANRIITLNVPADLAIVGDNDALKQIMLILLDNALKYSDGDIHVTAEQKGPQVEIRVQDHGRGMSPDKLEHVFDRFYRSDDAGNTPGFGLGLSIAKSLVENLGGEIAMKSEPGKGSEVIVQFPISSKDP